MKEIITSDMFISFSVLFFALSPFLFIGLYEIGKREKEREKLVSKFWSKNKLVECRGENIFAGCPYRVSFTQKDTDKYVIETWRGNVFIKCNKCYELQEAKINAHVARHLI